MRSCQRDARAAERFFRKVLNAEHNQSPRVINVDKNAVITPAIDNAIADQTLTKKLRRVKYPIIWWSKTIGSSNVARDGVCLIQYGEANLEGIRGDEHDPHKFRSRKRRHFRSSRIRAKILELLRERELIV